jgi:hypothetical protein
MKVLFPFVALLCLPAAGQVKFSESDSKVVKVEIDGKVFAEFHPGVDAHKPFLAPIYTASGKMVTRQFPMEKVAGESRDHLHHRGLWFSYDDVDGVKFWENDPSYTKPHLGTITVTEAKFKDGRKSGTLAMKADWKDENGKVHLTEDRTMTFHSEGEARIIDFDIKLTAADKVSLGDTKEGAFAIRLADSMAEKNKKGQMVNAEGEKGMAKVWGHKSKWVDYSGPVDGETVGVAMIDHPKNPRYPTYWHSRDYGLFALDPFGQKAFDDKQPESQWTIEKGQSIRFRWRVVVHSGDAASANIEKLSEEFAKK